MERAVACLRARRWWLGTAESVTAGHVVLRAAREPEASTWLRGGVIAFSEEVKQDLLGVSPGPVVTAVAAEQMARGAARALGADVVVSTTGVGGPDPVEGRPAGTVFVGIWIDGQVCSHEVHLAGDPPDVCSAAATAAVELLTSHLERGEQRG